MARIKFTALVESVRGTIAGTTFQRNAFGYTAKSKPNMVNPNTFTQAQRKQGFQKALQKWKTLTNADRAAWDTWASVNPVPSHNNPAAYLSGFNLYVRWHALTFQWTENTLNNPSAPINSVTYIETEVIRSGAILELVISSTVTGGAWSVYPYLSRPLGAAQTYPKSWTRFVQRYAHASPIDAQIQTRYTQLFGSLPNVGDRVGVDLTFQNEGNGTVVYIPSFVQTVTP